MRHHQWLTGEIGHPRLLAHIEGVKPLMQISDTWKKYISRLDRVYKVYETAELGFDMEIKKCRE